MYRIDVQEMTKFWGAQGAASLELVFTLQTATCLRTTKRLVIIMMTNSMLQQQDQALDACGLYGEG